LRVIWWCHRVYNHGGGILENCDSPRYMIHHVAGYVTCKV
jgi:hypothetical protein